MSKIPDQPPLTPKSEKEKMPEDKKETTGNSEQNDPGAQNLSKNKDIIDNLLGTLSSDMEKMGVRTMAKGHCASCGKCIAGKVSETGKADRKAERKAERKTLI